jgi:5-formyltetrahydrofolate cyclo-ligase
MDAEKKLLRREMRLKLQAALPERAARSVELRAKIEALPQWKMACCVALFYPLAEEPDLLELLSDKTKRFVFPCARAAGMEWREAREPSEFREHTFAGSRPLSEPAEGNEVALRKVDLIIVPGLAFTLSGERLGRGGGYYDRALAGLREDALSVGVCFGFQLRETLPTEPHDKPVHVLLHSSPGGIVV